MTPVTEEDAEKFTIRCLRDEQLRRRVVSIGYDVFVPQVIEAFLTESGLCAPDSVADGRIAELSPTFYSAAWALCRRGILRPGVRSHGEPGTLNGSIGNGYSVTGFGRQWIGEATLDDFVPTEPGRFAHMLQPFAARFGPGFYERAQEAVRCYGAHAYLACCAMCGAAAESILLAAAIEKAGDETAVLSAYASAQGRSRVQKTLLAHVSEPLRQEFGNQTVLLKYWRDEAAHGKASSIRDNEAYTSLAMLLRFAAYVAGNWAEVTRNPSIA